ncbi:MAG TPA: M20/M25/M40 family metallo-hydrolase, partial [candidate division Zixibacteria bacterium]|nr:M20/M25/M40 family metallo-hydrolase [candidate division Zixibacteria bacterium]
MSNPIPASDPLIDPLEILQRLIRFDTTNPPGNEAACIAYVRDLLEGYGIESSVFESQPGRANLVSRIKGRGIAPPLLLYGHVDVVTIDGQVWDQPPFEANIVNGLIWGRGTLDM